jgi:hypothetical protein
MQDMWQISRTLNALRVELAEVKYELACRRFVAELKANFNPSQPRAPRGSSIGGRWVDAGGGSGTSPLARPIPAQYRPPGGGRRGGAPPAEPLAQYRLETFNRTLSEIRRLEPGNSRLQYVAPPNYVPSNRTVNRTVEELEAARDRTAELVARHAFEEGHGNRSFGGAGQFELNSIARRTISDPNAEVARIPNGRTIYYDRSHNTLVIVNTVEPQRSTMFRPDNGQRYVDSLKK